MKRWLTGLLCVGSWMSGWGLLAAEPIRPPQPGGKSDAAEADPLIVHEWGTFTSYSGSDGGRLEFRPLFDDDLPDFVQDRSLGKLRFTKVSYRSLVRMETPVTYFYTKQPRDVRVKVRFPEGLLTEFFPPVVSMSPPFESVDKEPKKNSALDWGTVRLIPESMVRPAFADDRLAQVVQQRVALSLAPPADLNNHYVFARYTDSALVHVRMPDSSGPGLKGDFFEKFLFYRGLGDFQLPIMVTALNDTSAAIDNQGADPIPWMMLLDVQPDRVRYAVSGPLAGKERRELKLTEGSVKIDQAATDLTAALQATGLYEKEAVAMVKTWQSSWFGEFGTRLLYFVPQKLTDGLLPLEIEPRPAEQIRILVGRVEIMSPEREKYVAAMVKRSAAARIATYAQQREQGLPYVYPPPDEIQRLGRLAEPALTRVRHISQEEEVRDEAARLIKQLTAAKEAR